jgi:gliding motility-associated-like protein
MRTIIFFVMINYTLVAQTLLYNNGVPIQINAGLNVIVRNGDVVNQSGIIHNSGNFIIEGSITNNDSITGGDLKSGTYKVRKDWINNSVFDAQKSTVDLYGTSQNITGTSISDFNNLDLSGKGIKTQTLNASVNNNLSLKDAELATDIYEMNVLNPNTTAVSRVTGFVSSEGAGRLSRAMNSNSNYLFPVGSSKVITRYRPVEFKPSSIALDKISVRMANQNPTTFGWDIALKDKEFCAVMPLYYYHIYNPNQTTQDLTFHYDPATDDEWNRVGQWNTKWNNTSATSFGNAQNLNTITIRNYSNFTDTVWGLAKTNPELKLSDDVAILEGESTEISATYNAPKTSKLRWSPSITLDCDSCSTALATPTATTRYKAILINKEGCKTEDSLLVSLYQEELLIPNAFSPNGDGLNDVFRNLTKLNFEKLDMKVFNRWGEVVYESQMNHNQGWDGSFKGSPAQLGVYAYFINYKLVGNHKEKSRNGNVTLLR